MDYRELLHSQIEHPPPANAAKDLVRRLANEFELLDYSARPEQFVRVLCAGPFGIRHAVDIQPASVDAIRIVIAETDAG